MRRALRLVAAGTLVLLAAVVLGVSGGSPARAGWSRTAYVTATATSGVLNPVPTVACGAASGLLTVGIPITWTAPTIGGNAIAPLNYVISWTGAAGSGTSTVAYPATSGTVTSSTLTVVGTTTVTVTATSGSWSSPVSLQTRTVTTLLGLGNVIVSWTCA